MPGIVQVLYTKKKLLSVYSIYGNALCATSWLKCSLPKTTSVVYYRQQVVPGGPDKTHYAYCYEAMVAHNSLKTPAPTTNTIDIAMAMPPLLLVGVGAGVIPEQHSIWYASRASRHVPLIEASNSICMHDDVDEDGDAVVIVAVAVDVDRTER